MKFYLKSRIKTLVPLFYLLLVGVLSSCVRKSNLAGSKDDGIVYEGFLCYAGGEERKVLINEGDLFWLRELVNQASNFDRSAIQSKDEPPIRALGGYLRIPELASKKIGFSRNEHGLIIFRKDLCMVTLSKHDFLPEITEKRFMTFISGHLDSGKEAGTSRDHE